MASVYDRKHKRRKKLRRDANTFAYNKQKGQNAQQKPHCGKNITCAGAVMESASSRMMILNGGHGLPLQADINGTHDSWHLIQAKSLKKWTGTTQATKSQFKWCLMTPAADPETMSQCIGWFSHGWHQNWSEVQTVCIWFSWCHCIPKPNHLLPLKSRLVLPFWYWLT